MTEHQKKEGHPAPATCDMCGGTGMYGPDAVNCPCGITPAPAPQSVGSDCQYSKDVGMTEHRCAVNCQYEVAPALLDAAKGLRRVVEEIDGTMNHSTWRDDKGMRLKDTPEWIALHLALSEADRG